MKWIAFLLIVVATGSGVFLLTPASGQDGEASPAFVTKIPSGYRDWRFISTAHEAGNLNSIGVLLGNDVAIKAYREGKLPFPDGTMLAALHYKHVASDENNKIFGQPQSFVAGSPTNVQFMVKDSKKYAATGGWLRSLPGRQTRHRHVHQALLPLPREGDSSRLSVYPLCTLIWRRPLGVRPMIETYPLEKPQRATRA